MSGNRRHAAGLAVGLTTVTVIVRHYPDELAEKQALIDANRQRTKTHVQTVREYDALVGIETERGKQRMATNTGGAEGRKKFSDAEAGKAANKAAASLGLSGMTLAKGAKVLKAIDKLKGEKDQKLAAELEAALNKSYDGALKKAQEKGLVKKPKAKAKPSATDGTVKTTNNTAALNPSKADPDALDAATNTTSEQDFKNSATSPETQEREKALTHADEVATYTRTHKAKKLAPEHAKQWKTYLAPIVKWFNQLS